MIKVKASGQTEGRGSAKRPEPAHASTSLVAGLARAEGQPNIQAHWGNLRGIPREKRPARPQQTHSQKHKQILEATRSYSTREAQGKQAQGANKEHKANKHKGQTRAKQEAQGKHKRGTQGNNNSNNKKKET